jgi:predicted GH43/DUF377 family glycosyl hydrolase
MAGKYVMAFRNEYVRTAAEVKICYGAADTVECLTTVRVDDLVALCRA